MSELTWFPQLETGKRKMAAVDARQDESVRGCTNTRSIGGCLGQTTKHGPCVVCGALSCRRLLWIEPGTLRRRKAFRCDEHLVVETSSEQLRREERTRRDWIALTDPIEAELLQLGRLPEQLPGTTRAALRAFFDAQEDNAIVPDMSASTLNASLKTLGLQDEMYAETRGGAAVIRKVGWVAKRRKRSPK